MDAYGNNTDLEALVNQFLIRARSVRRYSPRTCGIYADALHRFCDYVLSREASDSGSPAALSSRSLSEILDAGTIREYEVYLLDGCALQPRTVNLHLSILSSFCAFLILAGELKSNPVKTVRRPKVPSRLPEFYRKEQMDTYFSRTDIYASEEYLDIFVRELECARSGRDGGESLKAARELYQKRLERAMVSTLGHLGIRRAELTGLNLGNFDTQRKVMTVRGKGDKMREIPVLDALCKEIFLYLKAVEALKGGKRTAEEPMFVTWNGKRIYPVLVDRAVKGRFADVSGVTGRRSPHVLRHTLATGLLDSGTDLNSIKEMLGHSSLAATQVYTHNSIAKLKQVYKSAHPRAKNKGGNYGD
ncbi:MAG: tyrosine-type recombinase/integrase [Candidatus Cryptobacteroides sp.]